MIFYFSGTGNTRWVARQLAEALGEQLVSIADALQSGQHVFTLDAHERIGFCFPTHGWQPPRIVRDFIRLLDIRPSASAEELGSHYCWALTTCGDDTGDTMTILNRCLAAKGLQASTLFSVIMPETYVCLPFMYTDTDERVSEKMQNARQQIVHITRILEERQTGIEQLTKGPTPRLYSYVIGAYFNRHMITDKKFTVDRDRCTQCGRCVKICPVANISGTPPEWLHNGKCTCCLACYHYCPAHAIHYGKITRRRGQYHCNP